MRDTSRDSERIDRIWRFIHNEISGEPSTDDDIEDVVIRLLSRPDTEMLRLRRVCHALGETLAKRCLDDANRDRETERTWPAGQAWPDLVGSSQSTFRHRAWEEAGLTKEEMRALLFDECGNPKEFEGCE